MLFSKKIATMIRAGLPIIDSLEMTENQVVDKKMKTIISGIVADLRGGFELSQCFAKHPKVFDNIYINMIKKFFIHKLMITLIVIFSGLPIAPPSPAPWALCLNIFAISPQKLGK